jgi:acetyl-CoA carboxylase carboxyl transferase subunit beta
MSWLSRVRSGILFLPKRQSLRTCGTVRCGDMVFLKEWEENFSVCPRCDFHDRIGPQARFEQVFDAAKYEVLPSPEVREDPLRFKDSKRYSDRLKAARTTTGERDALINARGKIGGHKVVLGVQDFAFWAARWDCRRCRLRRRRPAIKTRITIFTASGARMQVPFCH